MGNYRVTLEAAWLVKDVESVDDAMNIAISEIGKLLNPDLNFVDIEVGATSCPACGEAFDSVFMAAGTALVGILLEMKVYDAQSEEHAARIAKSTIGKVLKNTPLNVIEVEEFEGPKETKETREKIKQKVKK
ncbi:hypothetical protein ANME2D_02689 [Candidatus Methanoperedens nitroreducens]|uniref:UPF0212 protein ANME2D_02689 n=1 Tax=Candidatus Methanoperedens nitratireducens TaxID=1392998 RepID=A0A062UZS0_9EURY|nr:DUF555 domain-containing protein [Candidatus Methanoperedens nitroreducens]KCZ70667.1 hypothetical protein ANME2D_02689 [Candidatus Methanoperedens nitroreducens]MDJ1420519.1 DUF555 domain-containing protein [Candidatus Methanoperedens sp.]